jgi:hypothetical protein
MPAWLKIETRSGEPLEYSGGKLIPFARFFQLHIPQIHGGLIWSRPASILHVSPDGQETILAVPDLTRRAIWGMAGLALVTWFLTFVLRRWQSQ